MVNGGADTVACVGIGAEVGMTDRGWPVSEDDVPGIQCRFGLVEAGGDDDRGDAPSPWLPRGLSILRNPFLMGFQEISILR